MNYFKHYDNLIQKARNRVQPVGYTEVHHVLPRSMGGLNSKDNLVKLTGREHFIAHILLHKMYPNHAGMAIAILRMRFDKRRVIDSKEYEWIKISCSKAMSEFHKKHAKKIQNLPETKEKHRLNAIKQWQNPEHIENMRQANLKEKNPMYGTTQSKEFREQKSIKMGSKPFKVWKSILVKPSSKLGPGEYTKGEFVGSFININETERVLKVWTALIKKCLNKKAPQAQGHIFEYE